MKILFLLSAVIALSSVSQSDSTIDTQINQIMQAPPNQRVELMNQLKTKIAAMNASERNEALHKLSGNMGVPMNSMTMGQGSMIQNRSSLGPVQHQMNTNHQYTQPNRR